MTTVKCPLMQEIIEDVVCFDIHMVVEKAASEYTVPQKAVQTPGFREICLNCPNHRED